MNRNRSNTRAAFTLMEVLLVLIILVILGSFATSMVISNQNAAVIKQAKIQVGLFKESLGEFHLDHGAFPTSLEGLYSMPAEANPEKWRRYMDGKLPMDPWGNAYQFQVPGSHNPDTYDLWSNGPDRQSGSADDIGNW